MILVAIHKNKRFVIEEDNPDVGVYLSIYENGKCIKDYLQNSIEINKNIANREFGVPFEAWNEEHNT